MENAHNVSSEKNNKTVRPEVKSTLHRLNLETFYDANGNLFYQKKDVDALLLELVQTCERWHVNYTELSESARELQAWVTELKCEQEQDEEIKFTGVG